MADMVRHSSTASRRPATYRAPASDTVVQTRPGPQRMQSFASSMHTMVERPQLNRSGTSQSGPGIPLLPIGRRRSNPETPAPRDMGGYFLNAPVPTGVDGRRRSSAVEQAVQAVRRGSAVGRMFNDLFNPSDAQLIEPFSFVSTKTSTVSALKLGLGLLGQAGYTFGSILLVDALYQVPNPPGLAPGVGSQRPMGPDGRLGYATPKAAVGASVFSLGIVLGLTSSILFLADGVRIAGNRRKAFAYVSMHLAGIALISMSKFIITWRKNHTPLSHIIALSIPAGLGRGIHFVTIPRSFSNSEIVHGDFAPLTFEQRQIASEALRILAAIFFGLWAASWSVADFDPLEREGWGILASLTLNVSAALPNTNLRRADIFRRSQTSLLSPSLHTFRLGQPPTTNPNVSANLPSSASPRDGQAMDPLASRGRLSEESEA